MKADDEYETRKMKEALRTLDTFDQNLNEIGGPKAFFDLDSAVVLSFIKPSNFEGGDYEGDDSCSLFDRLKGGLYGLFFGR